MKKEYSSHRLLLSLLLLLVGTAQGWAGDYYAKLTATTSATGKGLVYAATTNTAPTADNQYKTSITVNKGKQDSQSFTYYTWAKPARGYQFSGWTGSSATVGKNPTGSGDAITVSGSEDSKNPTDGKVTANWSDATAYAVTYKQPENNGQYSVRYDYTTIASNALTAGSETYTMTTSTADQAVKSYKADKVTLSTSLSSFIGWYEGDTQLSTDKEYTYTVSKDATITAKFTAPKEYQASVTSNGETTQYKTIQEAITAANKLSTTPTVTLLDNITGVNEILTITKSMTLDLNGYTLSGAGGRRAPSSTSDLSMTLIAINTKGITVTIKDGSSAKTGTLSCTDELNHDLYTIRMDQGTLNLESGTIHCENPMKYVSGATRMRCYTIYGAPGCTINQTGATIEAVADYYAYGILTGGWYSGSGPAKVNVSGGKIVASAYNVPTGINLGYGDLKVTGGTIEADGTGGTWSSYGITVNAGASAQKKNEWKGTLTMSGGTVKATSTTSGARGIRINRSVAFVQDANNVNTQEVGSIVNGEATITGGTITAETTTSWPVAVEPYGDCTISGGTITANATTSDAYGVRVVDGTTHIKDGANITATAKTGTAVGVASIADTDGSKGTAYEGDLYVEGGAITAKVTSGSNARGIAVYAATRTITSTASGYYAGVYAAAGKATISGGKVSATASGSGANAVYVAATGTLTNATYGTASASPTCSITSGMFIASGTNAACVNSNAAAKDFVITGGDYQQNTNIATYIPDTKTVYQITGSIHVDAYNFGCRYYVSDWDNTKAIAKNTSTNTTYTSLKSALDAATSGQTVVLIENYRMGESETATVKNGVTLLIPYNSSYTSLTTKPTVTQTWTALSAFKTLHLSDGSTITVNNGGAICVAGQMYSTSNRMSTSTGGPGTPTGAFGCISMKNGGKITLQSGGNLYCWGFITGQNKDEGNNTTGVGTIDAQNGSTVYEDFVIGDWHGGSATSGFSSSKKFFPFNQYFIPNVEVPMTINYGSTLNTYCNISAGWGSSKSPYDVPVNNFIAKSGGMFNLASEGSSIKTWYDATTDEQHFDFNGVVTVGSLSVNLADYVTVDSKSYVMPLTSNMNMRLNGTFTAPYDMAILPGAKVIVGDDATANVSSNLYVYDLDNWDGYSYSYQRICYPFRPTSHYTATTDWTKKTDMTDAKVEVNGTLNMSGSLYTTAAGADICSNGYGQIKLTKAPTATATTYQVKDLSTETAVSVTAAQLHNADGSYVKTAGASAGTTYYYSPYDGVWQTSAPAATEYAFSGHKLSTKDGKPFVTKSNLASAISNTVGSDTLLSADFTNAKSNLSVAEMREQIGAKDGNNILLYTTANADGADNVVVKADDSYTARSLVITDKQPMDVPTAFTATNVTYDRTNSNKWGTVCVPYQLTSGNGIQYYQLDSVKGSTMYFTKVETVAANQPAIYSVGADGTTIHFGGTDVEVSTTAANNVASGSLTLVGVQTDVKTLHADSTDYYYIAQNKFWQPTKNDVTVRPQRAYFKTDGAASLAKVLSIGISDDAATGISSAETSEPTVVGIYTLGGAKLNTIEKGVNIVKMSDGSTRKIIVR